jgi:hypothetical protein
MSPWVVDAKESTTAMMFRPSSVDSRVRDSWVKFVETSRALGAESVLSISALRVT